MSFSSPCCVTIAVGFSALNSQRPLIRASSFFFFFDGKLVCVAFLRHWAKSHVEAKSQQLWPRRMRKSWASRRQPWGTREMYMYTCSAIGGSGMAKGLRIVRCSLAASNSLFLSLSFFFFLAECDFIFLLVLLHDVCFVPKRYKPFFSFSLFFFFFDLTH